VPGRVGIDGNEITTFSHSRLLTSTYRTWACPWHICEGWQESNHGLDKKKTWGLLAVHLLTTTGCFLKIPSTKRAVELLISSRNQVRIMTRMLTRHLHLKGHPHQLALVKSPQCDT
jgi:hypothetical protein